MRFFSTFRGVSRCVEINWRSKIENYIRVDTTTKNNKNYLNQQLKQLNPTTCAPINSLGRSRKKHKVSAGI